MKYRPDRVVCAQRVRHPADLPGANESCKGMASRSRWMCRIAVWMDLGAKTLAFSCRPQAKSPEVAYGRTEISGYGFVNGPKCSAATGWWDQAPPFEAGRIFLDCSHLFLACTKRRWVGGEMLSASSQKHTDVRGWTTREFRFVGPEKVQDKTIHPLKNNVSEIRGSRRYVRKEIAEDETGNSWISSQLAEM